MSKIVLITGASSGMGRASAKLLSENGFTVYAASRDISKLLNLNRSRIIPIFLDITSQKSIDSVVKKIIEKDKKIDILINNAGYGVVSSVENFQEQEMFNQFNVNVFGILRVTKAVIPHMRKENYGVIINISSFLGKIGLPLFTLYNASKYAVEGITDSLRYELSTFNIRVHSILPGFFDTEFARKNLVTNMETLDANSAYSKLVSQLVPKIMEQINGGNNADDVAKLILKIINDEKFTARTTVGDKAKKFIPMRRELSDEDFERRVKEYYGI
ncbi:SDR family oxidoreductase [Sulfurimonas sp.]|uniref:SDR family oxidoreductase n=1 Tax=Sulfurimonas sp. TaxID=2022749 RepID=UPI002624F5D8|nr:SDR family oxidoreductase [Sulfurimonas sp.]